MFELVTDVEFESPFLYWPLVFLVIELRSPNRRNTSSGSGVSPPCGFHSCLAANGLSVLPKPNSSANNTTTNTIANRISSAVHTVQAEKSPASGKTTTKNTTTKTADVKSNSVEFFDLSKIDDNVPTANASEKKVKYDAKGIQSNGLVALSDYFSKIPTAIKGYIALSVFTAQGLREDLLQHSLRSRSTKEKMEDS